jgi:hypothetical protein
VEAGPRDEDLARPTHRVRRRVTGSETYPAIVTLEAGTLLRRTELAQYLDSTCAGPFLSSVGRYEVLGAAGVDMIIEVTHGTVHDDHGPLIAEHPLFEALDHPVTGPQDARASGRRIATAA